MKFIWIIVSIFLFLFLFLSPLKATITEEEKDAAIELNDQYLLCGRHRFYLLCSFPLKNHDLHSQLQCLFFYYLDF